MQKEKCPNCNEIMEPVSVNCACPECHTMLRNVPYDFDSIAIEFAEWHLKIHQYSFEKWVELTTTELFKKFIEQRK